MKVVQDTPTLLVLKESAMIGIIISAVFVVIGAFELYRSIGKELSIELFTGSLLVFGLIGILFSKFITITIDKSQGNITITNRSVVQNKVQTVAINQIQEVAVQESRGIQELIKKIKFNILNIDSASKN